MSIQYRAPDGSETDQLRCVLAQSFSAPPDLWENWIRRIGNENLRVLVRGGRVIGGLGWYRMGQWFGGRCVPMAGIAGVGIAPEHRTRGIAARLMSEVLRELNTAGFPLSTLYASTQRLYRKVGYEQAGTRYRYRLPLQSLGPAAATREFHRVDPPESGLFQKLAAARARVSNGNLERNQAIWERLLHVSGRAVHAYVIGPIECPEGWLAYYQGTSDDSDRFDLFVRDMVVTTPEAAQSLWAFFRSHRSLAGHVHWFGPANDPLLLGPDEFTPTISDPLRWMMRIVDVSRALEERGYPPGAEGRLVMQVNDDLIAANNRTITLEVAGGRGRVEAGGSAELRADVRGLPPLFSGLFAPAQLQQAGWINGDDRALETAARLFASPEPWMPDMF